MATIAENLRRLRELKKMSQGDLAKAAHVTQQLISQLESPEGHKTTKKLPALAAALGVSVHEIDESFVPVDGPDYKVVELSTDGPSKIVLQYKFVGEPDPSDAELIALMAKASPAEREEFLFLLRRRHGSPTP